MSIEVQSASSTKPEFSVRITVCDHYLTKPLPGLDVIYSDFRGSDIKQVPILRVFGPTPDGRKACLHIHGVFPYFYIPCPTSNPEPQFLYQIAASLDKALNIALKQATSVQQHVYKISLVKGLPFYGFHDKDHLYLKVFLYNPGLIKQAVELCSNSAILGQPFQPHESHLNFTLQFFIDFNLFGMSNIDLQTVTFRKKGLSQESNEPLQSPDEVYLKAESSCFYEADCIACHIINRQRIGRGDGIENPGLEEVWNQEKERRKQLNMSMASKSLSQGRIRAEETESHYKFEQIFLIKMSNDINNPVKVESHPQEEKETVYYPAESMEGSQLFDAVDVSVHLPDRRHSISLSETFRRDLDETLTEDADNTIVDENVALNCSLHYSQVLLNSEDLELVDMLQDMEEQPAEEDSVMCTPAAQDKESEADDDAEYSQVFNEETVLIEMYKSKDEGNESSWNDSFWDGANIPQLDGTCDDDHVKKVRKRKMRPFKLGLSRPKKANASKIDNELSFKMDVSECDEINASRETIDSISSQHLKKAVKTEPQSFSSISENSNENKTEEESIMYLVDKISIKHNSSKAKAAESYDIKNNFVPEAGTSNVNVKTDMDLEDGIINDSNDSTFIDDSIESSFDNKQGIMSFYDMSKVFDMSAKNQNSSLNDNIDTENEKDSEESNNEVNREVQDLQTIKNEVSDKTTVIITPKIRPPTKNYILSSLEKYNIPIVRNTQPFYSDHKDVGDKVEIGQIILKLQSKLSKDQKPFERVLDTTSIEEWRQLLFMQTNEMSEETTKPEALKLLLTGNKNTILEPVKRPPTKFQILKTLEEKQSQNKDDKIDNNEVSKNLDDLENSQAIGLNEDEINSSISLESQEKCSENNTSLQITMQPDGSFLCFGTGENQKENTLDTPAVEVDFLTLMLTEVHTAVRGDLHPDPMIDSIQAIFIMITNDSPPDHYLARSITRIIVVDNMTPPKLLDRCVFNTAVTYVNNESELLELLIELIKNHDPDIMCGYEIEMNSWGYILERSQVLGLEMVREISRITEKHRQKKWRGEDNDMEGKIIGRISFNVWRLFRHELALSSYSFENCMYEVLKERVPKFSYAQLAEWWNHESRIFRWIPVEYYMTRLKGTVRMLEKLDIIKAGTSNVNVKTDMDLEDGIINDSNDSTFIDDSIESSFDNKQGIMSFYDMSKVFDMSAKNQNSSLNDNIDTENEKDSEESNNEVNREVQDLQTIKNEVSDKTTVIITPKIRPPTKNYILSSLEKYNIPIVRNTQPFYSDHKDVGDKVEIGQIILKLQSKLSKDQKPFERVLDTTSIEEWRQLLFMQTNEMSEETTKPEALKLLLTGNKNTILEPVKRPPTKFQILKTLEEKQSQNKDDKIDNNEVSKNLDDLENSQAIGLNEDEINSSISLESQEKCSENNTSLQITMQPDGSFLCFGTGENQKENTLDTPAVEVDFLTLMLTEVHTAVRGDLHPDPMIDSIQAIFIMITNDSPPDHYLARSITRIIVVDNMTPPKLLDRCVFNTAVTYVNNESELLELLIELIKNHDPDIMCGYEIEMNSWGYILERSQVLGLEMVREISRITEKHRQKKWRGEDNDMEGKIIGRISFNVWRLFRHELALSSYSFENCMYEVLKERVPKFSYAQLAEWWNHESRIFRWIPVEYYMTRLKGTVRMLEKLDIINRTSELARLFGLQWWEMLSRGSQFRVESLMLRAARPLNLIALSPTVKQRAAMRAPECLPLIFEPESRFYSDPVIVLDFQSLYPSMMIAYNYCFSTCIGRVQNINGESAYEFGAWRLRIPKGKLEALVKTGLVHWSPVGVGYVKSSVRRGVLPALLRRILAARQAVKKSMKMQTDEAVKKAMHSRQLGLKLIANVTYGYTAANFSGRMPCVEVGDSVVSKGRETLERAIQLVRNGSWNAKVVYGDTDSMFVLVPGGTRAEAFAIGQQIADAVTADNPSPVALKLEKVYQPCILQTKKRYVGYMYESPDQEKPVYEAKGIETVRRDGCPAGVKLLHRALCELFESGDMSLVKRSVISLLSRLADDSLPVRDLFFSREYNGPTGYRPGAVAVPNEIAKRIATRDRRAVPRTGWRVSWLVTAGAPAMPLVRLARTPAELAREPARPHVAYYATRVLLPPLHRCLSLLGVDVFKWWCELGYGRTANNHRHAITSGIARYMWRYRCALCGARGNRAVCADCSHKTGAQPVAAAMAARLSIANSHLQYCAMICNSCCGHMESSSCDNTECPVLWRRLTAQEKLTEVKDVVTHLPVQFCDETLDF